MHYTFQAHTFPTREDAVSIFHAINTEMQELVPDAFVTVSETGDHEYVVLFGCSDNDEDFIEHIEPIVAGCRPVSINMSVWMAMEANHCLIKQQHSEVFPEEPLSVVKNNVTIRPDGSWTEDYPRTNDGENNV